MAVRKNPDGSITVGIIEDEPAVVKPEAEEQTVEKPKAKKPKTAK